MEVRETALNVIMEVMEEGKYSHIVLKRTLDGCAELGRQERAFISRLCLGVIENSILLDYEINKYSKTKTSKMKPFIRNLLRMGAYQIGFMSQVPVSAACNESVKLAKKRGFSGLSGFVNAVLRSIARNTENFGSTDGCADDITGLSVKYSMPLWLTGHIEKECEGHTESILKALLEEKPVSLRINESVATKQEVLESFKKDGVQVSNSNVLENAVILDEFDKISGMTAFEKGMIQVQDQSSMLVCHVAGIKKGDYVIDVCAAPGGKSVHAADILMKLDKDNPGHVSSRDISQGKVALIDENIKRAGFKNISTLVWDALKFRTEDEEKADVVIADLPCSGIGIIGRKPDIKYKITKEQLEELSKLQKDILKNVCRYVRPGGTIVYSTCTVNRAENVENYQFILEELGFESISIEEELPICLKGRTGKEGYIQVLPTDTGMDGFFVSKAVKRLIQNK